MQRQNWALSPPGSPGRRKLLDIKFQQGRITQEEYDQLCERENTAVSLSRESQEWEQRRNANLLPGKEASPAGVFVTPLNSRQLEVNAGETLPQSLDAPEIAPQIHELEQKLAHAEGQAQEHTEELKAMREKLHAATQAAEQLRAEAADREQTVQSLAATLTATQRNVLALTPVTVCIVETQRVTAHTRGIIGETHTSGAETKFATPRRRGSGGGGAKEYTVFVVELTKGSEVWQVHKRYSEIQGNGKKAIK